MVHKQYIIHIHPLAPGKPLVGSSCNGCGVCCMVEPCPLGMVLSRRRRGACDALRWSAATNRYRCGAVDNSQAVLVQALPRWMAWLAVGFAPALRRLALRWIAAGQGCDSTLDSAPQDSPTITPLPSASTHPIATGHKDTYD